MLHHGNIRDRLQHHGFDGRHSVGYDYLRLSDVIGIHQHHRGSDMLPLSGICFLQDPRRQKGQQQIHQLLHRLQADQLCCVRSSGNILPSSSPAPYRITWDCLYPLHLRVDSLLLRGHLLHGRPGGAPQLQPPRQF